MINYDSEDLKFINDLLNKCIVIEYDNIIYYINNKSLKRLYKINKLLNKNTKLNINPANFDYEEIELIINKNKKLLLINLNNTMDLRFKHKLNKPTDKGQHYNYTLFVIRRILTDKFNYKDFALRYYRKYT